jgi:hypothetical protein
LLEENKYNLSKEAREAKGKYIYRINKIIKHPKFDDIDAHELTNELKLAEERLREIVENEIAANEREANGAPAFPLSR